MLNNNPMRYTDPTGHAICIDGDCNQIVHPTSGKTINRIGSTGTSSSRSNQSKTSGSGSKVSQPQVSSIIRETQSLKSWQRWLNGLYKPAKSSFGKYGGEQTANCKFCADAYHPGRDSYGGNEGDSIYAIAPGTVVKVGYMYPRDESHKTFGNYVVIQHEVDGSFVFSVYAHLQEKALVRVGEMVSRGQEIGGMGSTANQDPAHLHFEIRYSTAIDLSQEPHPFIIPGQDLGYWPESMETLTRNFVNLSSLPWD